MAYISANSADAIINYGSDWDDGDPAVRSANKRGSTATLRFRGSALYAFGNYDNNTSALGLKIDDEKVTNATLRSASTAANQSFLTISGLGAEDDHVFELTLRRGTLALSRLVWFDPQASSQLSAHVEGIFQGGWSTSAIQSDGTMQYVPESSPAWTANTRAKLKHYKRDWGKCDF
ncbi:hypothetical protein RhiJN_18341 [Ceratobasidium sp. AG-Ba]|nr:hypothetical protein RhiJN_18341 [Ceratobasidium sp. AG-Ba]